MSTEAKAMEQRARWALEKATHALFDELGEHHGHCFDARDCIRRLVQAYGLDFMQSHVERAKHVQAEGGMALPEGGLRTLGGVFFVLVKESVSAEAYLQVTLTRRQRLKLRRERAGRRPAPHDQAPSPACQNEATATADQDASLQASR